MFTRGRTLDNVAYIYDILSPIMTFGIENSISKKLLNVLKLTDDKKVLDVGCGTGTVTIDIAKKLNKDGSLVIGVDAAPRMIQVANKKIKGLKNIRFNNAAAEKLPYDNDFFDASFSTFFFHHVDLELKITCLNELWRVMKKGAVLAVADVDTPTSLFGKLCAWSGYYLFRQEEIRENIEGKLIEAFKASKFKNWQKISHHLGYISLFKLTK